MKTFVPENPSPADIETIDRDTVTAPSNQTESETGRAEMWKAVRTVMRSQRQAPPIRSVPRHAALPLSFAQQRLWFLHQFEPDSPACNRSIAYRVTGRLNVTALEQSLGEIIRRHEALRTTFATVAGQPVQRIVEAPTFQLSVTDLRSLPETERESEALRLANEATQQPFDLSTDLLLRATVLRLDKTDDILVLTTHQIVFDAPSRAVLMQELTALYEAFAAGKPSPLPELPIQYADFAHWQREWLQGEVLDTQLSYWKERLSTPIAPLSLPINRPRPGSQTSRGASQSFTLSASLSTELRVLSQREGVTLSDV